MIGDSVVLSKHFTRRGGNSATDYWQLPPHNSKSHHAYRYAPTETILLSVSVHFVVACDELKIFFREFSVHLSTPPPLSAVVWDPLKRLCFLQLYLTFTNISFCRTSFLSSLLSSQLKSNDEYLLVLFRSHSKQRSNRALTLIGNLNSLEKHLVFSWAE